MQRTENITMLQSMATNEEGSYMILTVSVLALFTKKKKKSRHHQNL